MPSTPSYPRGWSAACARGSGAFRRTSPPPPAPPGNRPARRSAPPCGSSSCETSTSSAGNPLALLRTAVRYPTKVLHDAGAPVVERDKFSRERFPDDDYDLTPANWSDIDPSLLDLGIAWGAAKAFEHKQRHRPKP